MRALYIATIFLTLSGCASLGPAFTQQEFLSADKALVYFYRPSRLFQGGGGPDVYINGVKAFRMHNGSYSYMYLSPGTHLISPKKHFNWGLDVIDKNINVVAGEAYYLRMDFSDAGVSPIIIGDFGTADISGTTVFNIVDSSVAEEEIVKTKLIQ